MRTSLFFGILFLSLSLVAQSNLTVFNNGGQKFYLIMNGIKQNSVAQTNVVVSGIKNGGYSVKLIFEDGKTKDIDKNFFLDTPQDVTTRVVFKKGVGKLQLVSMEPVAGTVAAGSVTYRPDNTAVFFGCSDNDHHYNYSNGFYGIFNRRWKYYQWKWEWKRWNSIHRNYANANHSKYQYPSDAFQ